MKRFHQFCLTLALLLAALPSMAAVTVRGTVTDETGQPVVGAEEACQAVAQRHGAGAGERGDVDDALGLPGLLGIGQRVAEHKAPFGVGVDYLDAVAAKAFHDVAGMHGAAVRHVLGQGQQTDKASKTTMTKEQQLLAGGFEKNKGRLPWPVEKGFISGHFGKQQHPVYEHVIMDNIGIYIQTTAGAKARAVYAGEVTSCFMVAGTYAVIIQHGNYRTTYSNLIKLNVKQGDKVEAKQTIGTIFTDPEQDQKTELYFRIYKDRDILNPELWLTR